MLAQKKNQTDSESTQDAQFRNIYWCIYHKNFCAITHQYHDVRRTDIATTLQKLPRRRDGNLPSKDKKDTFRRGDPNQK